MLYRPIDNIQNHDFIENQQSSTLEETTQHGIQQQNQQYDRQHRSPHDGHGHEKESFAQGQDGKRSILLDVPLETLTSITSYLTPPSLLSLGCVSSYLAHHVKEDNTWRRAFVCHFLGISPEADIHLGTQKDGIDRIVTGSLWKTLLLRRVEGRSWRDEFAWRYVMINRWSRSKSTTTTHTPVIHSNISSLHLMNIPSPANATSSVPTGNQATTSNSGIAPTPYIYPSTRFAAPALLSASNQYGIVARSLPLTGKVLTGYLDASTGARLGVPAFGAGNLNFGIGNLNGNPNAQFTPNVTASAITSSIPAPTQGEISSGHPTLGTAHIAWGTSAGDMIFTTASRAMNANVNDGSRGAGGRIGRSGVEVRRCRFGDEHGGTVCDVKWVVESGLREPTQAGKWAVSAGSDGRVKLWDAATAGCLWTSEVMHDRERLGNVPDPCVRVDSFFPSLLSEESGKMNTSPGVIVAVGESGDIYAWTGLDTPAGDSFDVSNIKNIIVDCPFKPSTFYLDSVSPTPGRHTSSAIKVSSLAIDPNTNFLQGELEDGARPICFRFLVAYENDPLFYRITLLGHDQVDVDISPFGNPSFGPTSIVKPCFGSGQRDDASFVLVGDHMGCVNLYDWNAASSPVSSTNVHIGQQDPLHSPHQAPIAPLRTFEAHRDGASVTALCWDGLVLVTGSARGTTHVWDGITFEHVRSFVSPVKRVRGGQQQQHPHGDNDERERQMVKHIVVNREKDVLVVSVGGTVMAWHAGVLGRSGFGRGVKGGVRGRHAPGTGPSPGKKRGGGGKFIGEHEIRLAIAESRDLLSSEPSSQKDKAQTKMHARREREHRERLDALGLSEVEAVEYALMLSREEAEARALSLAQETEEDGVFEADFDDDEADYGSEETSVYGVSPSVTSSGSEASLPSSHAASNSGSSRASVRSSSARLGLPVPYSRASGSHSSRIRPSPTNSNEKIQVVSTSHYAEPMEAGETYVDADVEEDRMDSGVGGDDFPPIPGSGGASPDQAGSVIQIQNLVTEKGKGEAKKKKKDKVKNPSTAGGTNVASTFTPVTPGGSPTSTKTNAWSVPLKTKISSSSSSWGSASSVSVSPTAGRSSRVSGGFTSSPPVEDMDEDLRFALELSLVEARSRGEDV